ncbi:uncharacterized protein LOC127709091 [Mytilus californianus]|uniref:uncharacterized protein LOC127709088 n=1 Tax=Mytilus californianus TaxID=6549 RepID=UPI002247DE29|nr:uncharacterized protein LOC127709088 [Mytilus californianus]XP_052070401.1 uncharacterized protein LOC127709089 isoform X1 [Mytilus californianus]XP_052070402.1 uncharacterized protein LOC127709089 isoform X2 [Mytilus californianus]XP_052070403.1 uncharacterized protein LOC127709089 isoform X3 [Mytilus californianus]XP_052070404.1 uncharacterized protein LOC127709091 [Mytilus californianus]
MLALVILIVSFAYVSGTSYAVPKECSPVFGCSWLFLEVENFFYDGDALKDVSAETIEDLCWHFMSKALCKEAKKCKAMTFATDMMKEMTRAVCVEYKNDFLDLLPCYNDPEFRSAFVRCVQNSFVGYDQNTCVFVDRLKNCASMFHHCNKEQQASAVDTMVEEYSKTICNHHKFNIGAPM